MPINLAQKYSPQIAKAFTAQSATERFFKKEYDFDGVATINVYSLETAVLGNYTRSGTSRYGTPTEVENTVTPYTLTRDRAFTKTIDQRNYDESMMVEKAGEWLNLQIAERVVPELDSYRLAVLGTTAVNNGKSTIITPGATNADNAYTNLLTLQENLTDDETPTEGRVAFMTAAYYNFLKQGNFVLDSEDGMRGRHSGNLGTVDGMEIQVVPASRMPASTDLVIVHRDAMVTAMELTTYKTHNNPPGINGWLLEGRVVYDAFVDAAKVDALAVHRTAV